MSTHLDDHLSSHLSSSAAVTKTESHDLALNPPAGWEFHSVGKKSELRRHFAFKDFSEAFGVITRIALLAEAAQHHPFWTNVYNQLDISLSTHDEGDVVTAKDIELAEAINGVVG